VSISWDEASQCPRDGLTGKVESRRRIPKGAAEVGGQLVTLTCPGTNCEYNGIGWTVQLRPDGTIPEPVERGQRERSFPVLPGSATRAQAVRDALAEQVELEQRGGGEIRNV